MSSSNKHQSRNSRTNASSRRIEVQWKDANPLKVGASTRKLPMALPVRDISVMGHAVDRRNNSTPISVAEECTSARTDTARSSYSMTVDVDPWAQYEGHSRPTGALYGLDMETGDGQSLDELALEAASFSTRLPSPAQDSTRQQQLHLHQPRISSSDDGGSNNAIFRRVSPRDREMVENSSLNRVDAARRSRNRPGGQQQPQLLEQKEAAANNARWLRGAAVLNLLFALFVLCYGAAEMHSTRVSVTVAAASSSSSTASSGRRRLMFQQQFGSNSGSGGGLRRRRLDNQQGGEVEVAHRKPKPKPKPRPGGGGGSSGGGSGDGTEDEEEKKEEEGDEEKEKKEGKDEEEEQEEEEEKGREKEGGGSDGETDRKRAPRDDSGRTGRDGSGGGDSDSGSESDSSSSSSDSSAYRKVYDFYASTIAVHMCLYSLYLYCARAVFKKEGGFRTSLGSGVFFASSCVWLGVAAIIIVIQIWTHALGYMASVYTAETVLNVTDLLYFSAACVLAGRELASIKGNDSTVALATPSSHHNSGSGGAGIIATLSESQHSTPSVVVQKPSTANATVAAPRVMPSAPSAAAVVGEKDYDVQHPPQKPPRRVKSSASDTQKTFDKGSGGGARCV